MQGLSNNYSTPDHVWSSIKAGVTPVQDPVQEVVVPITSAPGLSALAEEIVRWLNVLVPNSVQVPTASELEEAFGLLVKFRVAQVRGIRIPGFRPDMVRYPVVLLPIIGAIGDVEDYEAGLRILVEYPGLESESREVLAAQARRLQEVLDRLYAVGSVPTVGMEFAVGFPRTRNGSIDLFFYTVVQDVVAGGVVKSDAKTRDPVMAAVRAILEFGSYEAIVTRAQWSYGTITDLRRLFAATVELTLRGLKS